MRLMRVEYIPEPTYADSKIPIHDILVDFLSSDMQYAKVIREPGDYVRSESARQTLQQACRRYNFPIKVLTRSGEIYIAKADV